MERKRGTYSRRRLIHNRAGDNIRDIPMVMPRRDPQLRIGVESSNSRKMDITSQDRNPDRELRRYLLKFLDQPQALLLVRLGGVMVIKII
jgi:hypothetical protein